MTPEDLKVGMQYHFLPNGAFKLSKFHEENMFTIDDIEKDENGLVTGVYSNGGFLTRDNLDKMLIHHDGQFHLLNVAPISMLSTIWDKQLSFNKNFFVGKEVSLKQKQEYTEKFIHHVNREAYEVLDCVNWKMHRTSEHDIDREHLLEECIDVFKFLLCILQVWGFTTGDVVRKFFEKSKIVENRFKKGTLENVS